MTQKNVLLFLILLYFSSPAVAQLTGFEKEVPQNFKSSNGQELALSSLYYKAVSYTHLTLPTNSLV